MPWLDQVSGEMRAFIDQKGRTRRYGDRTHVYRVDDAPDGLYQVVSGEVRLYAYPAPGRQILTMIVQPGEWFGELSVIDGSPRPQDAVCRGAVVLRHLSMPAIAAQARLDPSTYGQIALIACAHQRLALEFIGAALSASGRVRLAHMLLSMSGPDMTASLPLSQEELAGRVGVTRSHLNLLIADLRRRGLISTSYGKVRVEDRLGLSRIADETV